MALVVTGPILLVKVTVAIETVKFDVMCEQGLNVKVPYTQCESEYLSD